MNLESLAEFPIFGENTEYAYKQKPLKTNQQFFSAWQDLERHQLIENLRDRIRDILNIRRCVLLELSLSAEL